MRPWLSLVLLSSFFCLSFSFSWPSQVPFWPNYPSRGIQVLDGTWQFGYTSNYKGDVTSTTIDTNSIATPNTTIVPSAFDYVPPGYEGPRGTAFYRTQIDIPAGTVGLLNFASCSFYCNVYVDNVHIGDHRAGGYAPFWLTVPPSSQSTRTLFVVSDNRFNSTTAPLHTGGDFYLFGGIHRSVIVHTSPALAKLYIQRLEISTADYENGLVNISVIFSSNTTESIELKVEWGDGTTFSESGSTEFGMYFIPKAKVPNFQLWSPSSPSLQTVTVTLISGNSTLDSIQARFGLRTLEIDSGSRLTLNGERIKLHGHNRHTMYPDVGPSLTVEQIQSDIKILLDLGDNYVRGAHYPQDQRFLDACDEAGILIWEEALGPGVSVSDIQSSYFMQYQVQQMNEMISASFNHPCVILFGFFNEGPSNEVDACPGYQACAAVVHERTSTHYATWASNQLLSDVCLKYADVISFNSYPAWYSNAGNSTYPLSYWPSILNQAAEKYTQPITVSETGCEGLFEWINTTTTLWGQEYQYQVIPNDVKAILGDERTSGLTLWVFADFKGNDSAQKECGPCNYIPGTNNATDINVSCDGHCGLGCRPCGENHKGTVDFWRREKLVYSIVQQMYHQSWP
eukprot:Phypoly_transcript_05001.p1 GENE.Phypoly_transcript_05001~~Phypoly_transcript_05001.p1  ORF type:complete len:641 (+),score=19.62 Phypoly_transcript_05001:49-1923(+)